MKTIYDIIDGFFSYVKKNTIIMFSRPASCKLRIMDARRGEQHANRFYIIY